MYIKVTEKTFRDAFKARDRDYYSDEEYKYLFRYYEDLEESIGKPTELDVIAIGCEWASMTLDEIEADGETPESLEDKTAIIECSDGKYLVQAY